MSAIPDLLLRNGQKVACFHPHAESAASHVYHSRTIPTEGALA